MELPAIRTHTAAIRWFLGAFGIALCILIGWSKPVAAAACGDAGLDQNAVRVAAVFTPMPGQLITDVGPLIFEPGTAVKTDMYEYLAPHMNVNTVYEILLRRIHGLTCILPPNLTFTPEPVPVIPSPQPKPGLRPGGDGNGSSSPGRGGSGSGGSADGSGSSITP